jgi:hypothetical protein
MVLDFGLPSNWQQFRAFQVTSVIIAEDRVKFQSATLGQFPTGSNTPGAAYQIRKNAMTDLILECRM